MKHTKRKICLLVLLVLPVLVLAGCEPSPDDLSVGAAYMTLNNPFFDPMNEGAQDAAEAAGAEYTEVDARLDVARQIDGVEDLIARNVSAIVLNPVDSDAIGPAVIAANEAGIPVITVDVASRDGEVIAHIASNNVEAGRIAGEFIAGELGEGGKVGLVDGPPITSFEERASGFREAADAGGLDIVAHLRATENSPEAFMDTTADMIVANPEIRYIFAVNDFGADAARAAIEAAGRDDVFVVGVDGAPDVVDAIAQGNTPIKATVGQQPREMGRIAVEMAIEYVQGEPIDELIYAPLQLVTQDNAADFSW